MRMRFSVKLTVCLVALCLGIPAFAQRGGGGGGMGPGGGGPGGGPGGGGGGIGFPGGSRGGNGGGPLGGGSQPGGPQGRGSQAGAPRVGRSGGSMGAPRGGIRMGPPGRWWDDRHYVTSLNLRPAQQQRMDAIFEGNRATLQQHLNTVQQEQQHLTQLEQSPNADQAAVMAQIDRVVAARTALERANAHVALALRKEMDSDQVERLQRDGQ